MRPEALTVYTMKRTAVCAAMLAVCCPSLAQTKPTAADRHEACELISRYAEAVMGARQNNADMAEVMKVAIDDKGNVEEWKRGLIIDAYRQPRWETEARKEAATRDYKNETYLVCMKVGE